MLPALEEWGWHVQWLLPALEEWGWGVQWLLLPLEEWGWHVPWCCWHPVLSQQRTVSSPCFPPTPQLSLDKQAGEIRLMGVGVTGSKGPAFLSVSHSLLWK